MTTPLSGILLLPVDNTGFSYVHERFPPGVKFGGPKSRTQPCIVSRPSRNIISKSHQQLEQQQQEQQQDPHTKGQQHQENQQQNQNSQPQHEQTSNHTYQLETTEHHQEDQEHLQDQPNKQQQHQQQQQQQQQSLYQRRVNSDMTSSRNRKLNVSLPSLPFDNYPMTPRKNKNCSFVNNHKMYLKLKGYQINDVYSLNRRRNSDANAKESKNQEDVANNAKKVAIANNIDLPPIFLSEKSPREKKRQWQTIQEEVWRPQDSRKLPSKNAVLPPHSKHLDRELHVPGHVRSRDVSSLKLGKVLTQARMRELLTEEETSIPSGFYL